MVPIGVSVSRSPSCFRKVELKRDDREEEILVNGSTDEGLRVSGGLGALLHYSSIHLLCSLVLMLAVTPFIDESRNGQWIEVVLMTVVLVSAGLAVGGRRRLLGLSMLMLLPTVTANWVNHLFPSLVTPVVHLAGSIIFTGFIVYWILCSILRAKRVDSEVICAGVSIYLLLGLMWTFAYMIVAIDSPLAFNVHTDPGDPQTMTNFNALYFSYTTLTTLGIGDITPVSKVARTLAYLEAMTGMLFVAILISRLVALYSPANNRHTRTNTDS